EHLLPVLLSAFRKKHPHIRVRAAVSDSMSVMAQIERGEASLGLVGRRADKPNLEVHFLASDRMVLVVPSGHPLAGHRQVTVRQICRQPLILREVGSGLRHCFEKALEKGGYTFADLQVAVELGSNEAIKEALLQGDGIAILSTHAIHKELDSGQLKALRIRDLD